MELTIYEAKCFEIVFYCHDLATILRPLHALQGRYEAQCKG